LAALAGIGTVGLWNAYRRGGGGTFLLPLTLLLTAAWQAYVQYPSLGWKIDWEHLADNPTSLVATVPEHLQLEARLMIALLGGTIGAAVSLILVWLAGMGWGAFRRLAPAALAVGWLALLTIPVAWALSNVLVKGNLMLPAADLRLLTPRDNNAAQRFQ